MFLKEHRRWKLMVAILTLSLLTVMAGAAVAPALGVIQEYFSGESKMMVQLIISMPAVFIAVTNLFFERLCRICKAKTLTLIGLGMYIIFGCGAGLFSNIYLVLVCRALVGVGVGIIMPMSTGLITYYFTRDKQDVLMGYSSAMNMLGGVVATLIAGALAMINWRMSFLVYLLGVISIVPVALWMPNERIIEAGQQKKSTGVFRNYYPFIVGMFFLMVIFFNYPANFAMESSRLGTMSEAAIPVIMALGDVFGFLGGLAYPKLKKGLGRNTKVVAPLMFLVGYLLLQFRSTMPGTLLGSFLIGAANGIGVPYFISTASAKAGRNASGPFRGTVHRPVHHTGHCDRLRKNPGHRDCERHILPRGHFAFFAVYPVVRVGGGPKTGKIEYIHFLFEGVYCLIRNSMANAW